MKRLSRIFVLLLLLIVFVVAFRGWIFRKIINYATVGQRNEYAITNASLKEMIEGSVADKKQMTVNTIMSHCLALTSKSLHFSADKVSNDPNLLIESKAANCIGYAAFYATVTNYLFNKYELQSSWNASPQIGKLFFMEHDVHEKIKSPFFRDHDFVLVQNSVTGETVAVDPSLHDYARIDHVNLRGKKGL